MRVDPTITITCDYLVEFTDDAENPSPGNAEVIELPPVKATEAAANDTED
jgi:hypothetical protein